MKIRSLAVGFLACLMSFGAMSCATPGVNIPTKAMPAGASYSGLWYSNFGDMKLTQKADGYTRGTFDYKTGGEIDGHVEGGVYKFSWLQQGDFQVGRRDVSGHGYLIISDDGLEANGEWGYGENYSGAGVWTARKATEIYINN